MLRKLNLFTFLSFYFFGSFSLFAEEKMKQKAVL